MPDFFTDSPLFEDAPVAYSVIDASGAQVAANKRFWDLFGYSPGTELSAISITHEDSVDETNTYLDDLWSGAAQLISIEKRYVRSNGEPFWGRLTARRLDSDSGRSFLLGVIEDIEEQHRLQNELRRAAEARSEFVARVSHELRNPLHTIAGMAELIATSEIVPQLRRQAEVIVREASGLTSIVSDLLDIGRIEAGNFAVESEPFSVRNLIDRSVRSGQALAEAKGLRMNVHVDDAVPINAVGDSGRLGQILDNLVGNGIKFTSNGSVTLRVRAAASDVIFDVEDTGPGIPETFVDQLFDPFQRLNESTAGAGLGLTISRRLAESMGGSLELLATSVEGTIFRFAVPLEPTQNLVVELESEAMAIASAAHAPKVLVVEDNPETQMLASAQLDRLGYDYDIAGDGYLALHLSEQTAYDAILMDWHLPGMDGLETTRRIRQRETREGRTRVPIISVTARAMAADIEACRAAGADDFVAKPASVARIGEVLAEWITSDVETPTDADGASDDELAVDLLEELGDPSIVVSLTTTFLNELPRRVQAITREPSDANAELVAHTLASTSAMFGAEKLRSVAKDIETTSREGQPVSSDQRKTLISVAEQTQAALAAVIRRLEEPHHERRHL